MIKLISNIIAVSFMLFIAGLLILLIILARDNLWEVMYNVPYPKIADLILFIICLFTAILIKFI